MIKKRRVSNEKKISGNCREDKTTLQIAEILWFSPARHNSSISSVLFMDCMPLNGYATAPDAFDISYREKVAMDR